MKVEIQITENTSQVDFKNEKYSRYRLIFLIPTIKKRLHENLPIILNDISKKLDTYHWIAELYCNIEEHFMGPIFNTRIFLKSSYNPSIYGELLVENKNYLNLTSPSPYSKIKKGSLNFLITNENALDLTFENIENRNLKYSLDFRNIHSYDNSFTLHTGIEEIDGIHRKLKKFFEINEKASSPFNYIWPVILISDSISWKFIAELKNIFEGYNINYHDQDNSIDNCDNLNFLKETLTILKGVAGYSNNLYRVFKHLSEIELNEEVTDEELFEILTYLRLIEY